ncbi:Stk1 family PASTA domain-containing Ser/Thr kinase [Amycolatopsis anabasis]|uniref:Stk1 family PASTA domain-containing Ser/Thr kinase n=1 Tax=Amycolatopsis anabasis TaxID=1840409 RepID=UPI00131CE603|nr:PASTA domain-containing protein [Amycolatopsis anabasis]
MTSTDTSLVGTLLDRRYRVDRLLARGGMSSVYRGMDTRLDRPVAIKIMDPRFADDRSFVERFEREARSAAKLHHPHVVAVHDQGVDGVGENSRAFLVMELVDGGTLRDLLDEQGALDVPLALSVAEPVLSALAAAHRAGLVHRDVKPENVLIGRGATPGAGVVKVGDFGLVRAVASAGTTSSSIILGTVAYLSPEQVTTGAAMERGDVYSTGILLYEMLTGQAPYTGDTAISVAYRHVNDDVPAPSSVRPGIPRALDDLVLRATRRDDQARPADAGAFLEELQQVRTALGISPVPVPVPPPPDVDKVSDVEATTPNIPAVQDTSPMSGPRGTRALMRGEAPPWQRTPPAVPPPPGTPPPGNPIPAPETPDKKKSRTGRLIALWAVVALVLGGLIGAGIYIFAGDKTVPVPQVAGLSQADAGSELRKLQLNPKYAPRERNNTVAIGKVIRTDPEAGTKLNPGEEVTVVVSAGRPAVPDIQPGTTVESAEQQIRAQQLEPVRAAEAYDAKVAKGQVLKVDPTPGTQLDIGTKVNLTISKGPPPNPVPNVVGKPKDDAFKALRAAGFEPVDGGAEFSADVPAGSVTRINPAAGTTPAEGGDRRVTVWVSESSEVPSVIGRMIPEAIQILTQAGLQPDVKGRGHGDDDDGGSGFGWVIDQDPKPGSRVQKGTTVKLKTFP